jgi:hypothetical protein
VQSGGGVLARLKSRLDRATGSMANAPVASTATLLSAVHSRWVSYLLYCM